jgi:phospholipid transport system substrate-binding protein
MEDKMKKILAVLVAFVLMFAASARADELDDAKSWAQEMIGATVTEIFVKDADRAEQVKSFRRSLAGNFDFAYIGRFVLGVYGKKVDEGRMERFIESFAELNVQSYSRKFANYDSQKVEVTDAIKAKKEGEFFVDSKALASDPSQKDTDISWRLAKSGGAYKVIDVVIEGVSMAMSYKNEYAPILKAASDDGRDPVDDLVKKIDAKIETLKSEKPKAD